MPRFFNGLNKYIVNYRLQHYMELEDIVHMTTKVERQIKRRGNTRFHTNFSFIFLNMKAKSKERGEGVVQPKPYTHARGEPFMAKNDVNKNGKSEFESQTTHERDIKCFKCLKKGYIAF